MEWSQFIRFVQASAVDLIEGHLIIIINNNNNHYKNKKNNESNNNYNDNFHEFLYVKL